MLMLSLGAGWLVCPLDDPCWLQWLVAHQHHHASVHGRNSLAQQDRAAISLIDQHTRQALFKPVLPSYVCCLCCVGITKSCVRGVCVCVCVVVCVCVCLCVCLCELVTGCKLFVSMAGKFMVVEGQVMDTMKWQPQPLPCEVSDIGHAVYDGADALMLGAATSIGVNPVEVSHSPLSEQRYNKGNVHYTTRPDSVVLAPYACRPASCIAC